jgi:hypothetical protein
MTDIVVVATALVVTLGFGAILTGAKLALERR